MDACWDAPGIRELRLARNNYARGREWAIKHLVVQIASSRRMDCNAERLADAAAMERPMERRIGVTVEVEGSGDASRMPAPSPRALAAQLRNGHGEIRGST